jgi:hypothetical protein
LDFLKIDTEGHDFAVLSGALNTILKFEPLIEFESSNMSGIARVSELLQGFCSAAAYEIYRCCNQYPFSLYQKYRFTNNYFAISESRRARIPDFLFSRGFLIGWGRIDLEVYQKGGQ